MCLQNSGKLFCTNKIRPLFKQILLAAHEHGLHADTVLLFNDLKHSRLKAFIFVGHHIGDDG